jgi:RsiW-degrading membrane proteinase PrsW (M82 family)
MRLALIPLYAVILPFIVWPIEIFLPYPYLIEEIAKGILIYFISQNKIKYSKRVFLALSVGILFTLSESILYLFNIYYSRNLSLFFERLLFTGILHTLTSFVIFFSIRKQKYFLVLGILIAIIIHYLYNLYIPNTV